MGYVEESLVPGEQLIFKARTHWAVFITPVITTILVLYISTQISGTCLFLAVLACLIYLINLFIIFFTTEFALTNRRIIAKTGFFRRQSLEIMLTKVESISINQTLNGRLYGYGSIIVCGSGGTRQAFPMIAKPMELRSKANAQIALLQGYGDASLVTQG